MPLCRFGDLVVDSELSLPETVPATGGPATCRVRVVRTPDHTPSTWTHHWRSPDGRVAVSYEPVRQGHRLGFPGLAEFVVREDGREIWCRPIEPTPEATLRHLLLDQVLPRAMSLGARLVLHGGCVVEHGTGHVLLGPSGAGKSTLCAALEASGFLVAGDDCAIVDHGADGRLQVRASYPGIRLFPDALDVLVASASRTAPVAHYTPKRRVAADPVGLALDPVPLRGLYLLEPGAGALDVARLRGAAAYVAILRSLFQLRLEGAWAARPLFELVGALVRQVPVQRLRYARSFDALPEVACETARLLRAGTPARTARGTDRGSGPRAAS